MNQALAGSGEAPIDDWTPRPTLEAVVLEGRTVRLEPLDVARHAEGLWDAFGGTDKADLWTYMPVGPFLDEGDFANALSRDIAVKPELRTFAIGAVRDGAFVPQGMASLMSIVPTHGVAEVGMIAYGPALQRTTAATEAMLLMARHVFSLGYRRYEWKCNARNAPSMRAALRLGFSYEGTFRNHMVVKARSRDTAWFSITDEEWPAREARLEAWVADARSGQPASLSACPV